MSENENDELLSDLGMDDDIQDEKDSLGGGFIVESSLQDLTIEAAFITKSKGGAKGFNLHTKNPDGIMIKDVFWMTSKKGLNYYMRGDDKQYMMGFNQANAVCLLTVGKNIQSMSIKKKLVDIWDFEAEGLEPTPVPMFIDLIGKTISAGVLKVKEDKKKNVGTDEKPEWKATGETREKNVIDKIFKAKTGMTVAEVRAKAETPAFRDAWAEKWEGKTKDESTGKTANSDKTSKSDKSADTRDALFAEEDE